MPKLGIKLVTMSQLKDYLRDNNPAALRTLPSRNGIAFLGYQNDLVKAKSTLEPFDFIFQLNGTNIASAQEIQDAVRISKPGEMLELRVFRSKAQEANKAIRWNTADAQASIVSYADLLYSQSDITTDEISKVRSVVATPPLDNHAPYLALQALQKVYPLSEPSLRLKIHYGAKTWLFVENVVIDVNGQQHNFQFTDPTKHIFNDATIYEQQTFSVDPNVIQSIIANAENCTVRFKGRDFHRDLKLSPEMVDRLTVVYDVYALATDKPTIGFVETATAKPDADVDKNKPRMFTDNTGKFKVEAVIAEVSGENVTLKKSDGTTIVVPISRLSKADQQWIEQNRN